MQGAQNVGSRIRDGKTPTTPCFHGNGGPAEAPIALCEVQGYVYQAKLAAAGLASVLGYQDRADALTKQAEELKSRFDTAFWCDDIGSYALALDGAKRQCRVRASNAGHVLYSGIANAEREDASRERC